MKKKLTAFGVALMAAATLVIPFATVQAGPGTALSFNGTGQYVALPAAAYCSKDFTIEAWVYVRSHKSDARLVEFGNAAGNTVALQLSSATSGRPTLVVCSGTNCSTLTAPSPLPLNAWVHLAATLDLSHSAALYTNGQLAASSVLQYLPGAVTRTNSFIARAGSGGFADAIFDEVRIWGVALEPTVLQARMNHSLRGDEPDLVAYWAFDEGAGHSTVTDGTANGYDGTLVPSFKGPAWVASGVPFPPDTTTSGASEVTQHSALLNGKVSANNLPSTAWFIWGEGWNNTDHTNPPTSLGSSASEAPVSSTLTALQPGTTYSFRLVAANGQGTNYGSEAHFITLPNTDPEPSTDAELSALTLSSGAFSPAFDPAVTNYSAAVADPTTVTITPTCAESHATIQVHINGVLHGTVTSGHPSSALALTFGLNDITVQVTAQDGTTTKSYTLAVMAGVQSSIRQNADGTITLAWTNQGQLYFSPTLSPASWQRVVGAASPYTFTPTGPMGFGCVKTSPGSGSDYVVGYVNVTLKKGFNLVANPLYNPLGNTVAILLGTRLPDGSVIYKFDSDHYDPANGFSTLFGWDNGSQVLFPGEGAWVYCEGMDSTITFVGEVPQGTSTLLIHKGSSLISTKVPQSGDLAADLGFPAADGDVVYIYDGHKFRIHYYAIDTWYPQPPRLGVGGSFFVRKAGSANWTHTFIAN